MSENFKIYFAQAGQGDGSFAPVLAGLLAGVLCFLAIRNHMRRK